MLSLSKNSALFSRLILEKTPFAQAYVHGVKEYARVNGMIKFYIAVGGVIVNAEVKGLPSMEAECQANIFAMHIHSGKNCDWNSAVPYENVGEHLNPLNCPHPAHMGDLEPLFSNNGYAWYMYFTNRFTIQDIVGRTIIIHSMPDDFTTQPSGNSGDKIACGEISIY